MGDNFIFATHEKFKQADFNEFLEADDHLELADVLEVIRAICDSKGVDYSELEAYREDKEKRRGRFTKKIILERTE